MVNKTSLSVLLSAFWGFVMSVVGGIISGAFFGVIYFLIYLFDLNFLLNDPFMFILSFFGVIVGASFFGGLPIGFIVGIAAGLHFSLFKNFHPNTYIWVSLITASTIVGGWLSRFNTNILFFVEISFVGLISSLLARKYSISQRKNIIIRTSAFLNIACSINVAVIVLLAVYKFFALWKYYLDMYSF